MGELDTNLTGGESLPEPATPKGKIEKIKNHRLAKPLQGDGLRAKALRGSGWTIAGFGAQQVLRLGSNLILTRLLFPEAFGLMALAQVFMQGLAMLSDIGVGPAIVQNKRGDDPEFLATAWTMQIVRGFILFAIMCAMAYPASKIYDQPLLLPILILIGVSAVIQGFQSIGIATANRKMILSKLTMMDLCAQCVGIAVMVTWAFFFPTVWALVGGGLAVALMRLILGHTILRSSANHFKFDRSAAGEIYRFGRWIFLATALTYFGGQGLRLIQGYFVSIEMLGLISIAGMLGLAVDQMTKRIGNSVLFPAFAQIHQDRPQELAKKLREARTKLFLLSCPVFFLLIILGRDLIHWMYDDRYLEAGVFLVIMATGSALGAQRTPFGMVLIATGDSFGHALIMSVTAVGRIAAIFTGFKLYGVVGMLIADVMAMGLIYPFEAWRLHRKGLWLPIFDLTVFTGYIALGALSYLTGPYFFTP